MVDACADAHEYPWQPFLWPQLYLSAGHVGLPKGSVQGLWPQVLRFKPGLLQSNVTLSAICDFTRGSQSGTRHIVLGSYKLGGVVWGIGYAKEASYKRA